MTNTSGTRRWTTGAWLLAMTIAMTSGLAEQTQDLVYRDLAGKEHRLSELRGKWVVMNFWATWCPPCIHEMPELEAFHRKHKDVDAVVWGITFEDTPRDEVREFVAKLGVTYPILGHGEQPSTPYGRVSVLPTTFLIDPQGKLAKTFRGPITAADLEQAIAP